MHKSLKKTIGWIVVTALMILFVLYFIRVFNSRDLDDVNPSISCEDNLYKKSEVLWVIPLYKNKTIGNETEWCNYILSMNKTMGMHGVYHTYNEFSYLRDNEYIDKGIASFEECFGFKPVLFKAPQLAFSEENRNLVESYGLTIKGSFYQLFHKAYHCSDTGKFSNRLMDYF